MEWSLEHGVWVATGRRGWYVINPRCSEGQYHAWYHHPDRTGVPLKSHQHLDVLKKEIELYDEPRRKGRNARY